MTRTTSWTVGLVSVLVACAQPQPTPTRPPVSEQPVSEQPVSAPDASGSASGPGVDAGSAPDASAPASASLAPIVEPPSLIDLGLDAPGQLQVCPPTTRFSTLAEILARRSRGRVAVRARVWVPATYPCTDAIPEYCFATPVLARSKPTDAAQPELFLVGNLSADTSLACSGRHQALRCPLPFDGREYGITGVLSGGDEGPWNLAVESLCRFAPRGLR